jgi:hypothetical protein
MEINAVEALLAVVGFFVAILVNRWLKLTDRVNQLEVEVSRLKARINGRP